MPPIQRRCLSPLGRAVIDIADEISTDDTDNSPLIFASRYGDMERSIGLLTQLSQQEGLSPTQFGLSVHNAIGAFFSIAKQYTDNYTAVAAGQETCCAAFLEAISLLNLGHSSVRVICYDAPLPSLYEEYFESTPPLLAWGCVLSKSETQGFSLSTVDGATQSNHLAQSDAYAVFDFLKSQSPQFEYNGSQCNWLWQRHG